MRHFSFSFNRKNKMNQLTFNEKDLGQMKALGITAKKVRAHIAIFKRESFFQKLIRPCTLGDGIISISEKEIPQLLRKHQEGACQGRLLKFAASAAAHATPPAATIPASAAEIQHRQRRLFQRQRRIRQHRQRHIMPASAAASQHRQRHCSQRQRRRLQHRQRRLCQRQRRQLQCGQRRLFLGGRGRRGHGRGRQ